MSEDQTVTPAYSSKLDELSHNIEGVEAAIQAAIRNDDDQEWLHWLQKRRDDLLSSKLRKRKG